MDGNIRITRRGLLRAGLRVVIVEEGAYRTPPEFTLRELPAFSQLYVDGGVRQTRDGGIGVVQGRAVGGSTTVNWTSSFRTPEPVQPFYGVQQAVYMDQFAWRDRVAGCAGFNMEAAGAQRSSRAAGGGAAIPIVLWTVQASVSVNPSCAAIAARVGPALPCSTTSACSSYGVGSRLTITSGAPFSTAIRGRSAAG